MEKFFQKAGKWAVIMARPVPVLAEASVFFAGISRMNFSSFMWASTLSNLGIAIVYAAVGVYAVSVNSVLLAFSAAMILPAIAFGLQKIFEARSI
jgi:membrane protein DedA with SNARE-associated domain